MYVVATAGHVDHGKSTLIRLLTGMEPDRWAEERRRGMTIDLGFAWARLPDGGDVAFVDVPGHERFVPNMLAGVGPVPAVMFVVAADEGWMPQSQEHLDALSALDVRHGLLVVTRSDLAEPELAVEEAQDYLRASSLGEVPAVAVSGRTGAGLDELRAALARLVGRLPAPDLDAPVRLWVDRAFTIRGSGTVVTGTLPAGRIRANAELALEPGGRRVRVRGLQTLGRAVDEVASVARVAVNLRGLDRDDVGRGDALVTPDRWMTADRVDVRLTGMRAPLDALPAELVLHIGSAAVPVRVRPLGSDTARLRLATDLPLRIGDRALVRDPGAHAVVAGVTVLDVRPPALRRRGAAAALAAELATRPDRPDGAAELRRRRVARAADLRAMGVEPPGVPAVGDWLLDPTYGEQCRVRLLALVRDHAAAEPLDPGLPVEAARARLGLPDVRLVAAVVRPPLELGGGRVRLRGSGEQLPPAVDAAVRQLERDLAGAPFAAPEAGRLSELGLGPRELGAAVRAGRLVTAAEGVVLLPHAVRNATALLAALPQPFTTSEARQALGTSRRVVIPLLELLDRRGLTLRQPDDRRRLSGPSEAGLHGGASPAKDSGAAYSQDSVGSDAVMGPDGGMSVS